VLGLCACRTVATAVCLSFAPLAAHAARSCEEWSLEITTVEGRAEVQRGGEPNWMPLGTGDRACFGDVIQTLGASRVTLTLPDGTTQRVDEHSTFSLPEPPSGDGVIMRLLRGAFHVISRDPRELRFTTPYANAGLEGTEFDIRVDEERKATEVVVLEGEVVVTTAAGEVSVKSNHIVTAREGEMPTVAAYATPIDLMRWAGHYPPVVAGPLPAPEQTPSAQQLGDPEFFARRAAARLGTARVAASEDDIAAALRIAPRHSTALALRALLALERADRNAARALANDALAADATSTAALVVLAYVEQTAGDLGAAERAIRRAVELEPDNALALTKLAELSLARGDSQAAIAVATRAAALAPQDSAPLAVLGFASARAFDVAGARDAFAAAVELEPQAPLPHLGLGLALQRLGDERAGRREIELAVALDPDNSLIRSYMAATYAAEDRAELAASQLALAKGFDPGDPTAWIYSALDNLRSSRPVTALQELRLAADKNRGLAAYRSSLVLDEDLATRSAAFGRVYTEMGFGRLGELHAWQSIAEDPMDFAAHRLLADVYSTEPGHEVARISELFFAQLLQPANTAPVKPQLGQPNSFIAQRFGPSALSFDELDSPVIANGPELRTSAVGGGNGTAGHDVAIAGLRDRVSYGGGHYRFTTDGFRENNDVDQGVGNAFIQYRPSDATHLQAELRAVRGEFGDLTTMFDSRLYSPILRQAEQADSLRLSAQHRLAQSQILLGSLIVQDARAQAASGAFFSFASDHRAYDADVQYVYSGGAVDIQSGLAVARRDTDALRSFAQPGGGSLDLRSIEHRRQFGLYSYAHYRPVTSLTLTLGVALDDIESNLVAKDAVSPKLGIVWRPMPRTTVRAAAFEALFGSATTSFQNTQPRLEPVQVAGFTQLLPGSAADDVTGHGLGIEHELSSHLFVGWQADVRDIERLVIPLAPGAPGGDLRLSERTQMGYLLWAPSDRLSVSARYDHGRYRSSEPTIGYSSMTTERLPLEVRYFARSGFTMGARVSVVKQHGIFLAPSPGPLPLPAVAPGQDSFSLVDAFIGYRLPNRRGLLSLNADNLLDRQFQFQDVDPLNPSMIPERLFSFRFTLAFD
jgi:tetratricopeptide (TPR) repeat protein